MKLWRTCRDKLGVPNRDAIQSLDGEAIIARVVMNGVPHYELRRAPFEAARFSMHPTPEAAKAAAEQPETPSP